MSSGTGGSGDSGGSAPDKVKGSDVTDEDNLPLPTHSLFETSSAVRKEYGPRVGGAPAAGVAAKKLTKPRKPRPSRATMRGPLAEVLKGSGYKPPPEAFAPKRKKTVAEMARYPKKGQKSWLTCGVIVDGIPCPYGAPQKDSMRKHQSSIHNIGVVWYTCGVRMPDGSMCGYKAKQQSNLKTHQVRAARGGGLTCDWCAF